MQKTIAQQLNLKVEPGKPFEIHDQNKNRIYFEGSNGYWSKCEFDQNNNEIYYEDSYGFWSKREFDQNNNEIYYEDSKGSIMNNRPKPVVELTLDEIASRFGIKVENLKIKK